MHIGIILTQQPNYIYFPYTVILGSKRVLSWEAEGLSSCMSPGTAELHEQEAATHALWAFASSLLTTLTGNNERTTLVTSEMSLKLVYLCTRFGWTLRH